MTDEDQEAAVATSRIDAMRSPGLTIRDIQARLECVQGVVLVRVRLDPERHQVWLHVRGGHRDTVMRTVLDLENYKPVHIHFQVDHKRAREHHRVIAETPWLNQAMIG